MLIIIKNKKDLSKFAKGIAAKLATTHRRGAAVIGLVGNLGAGKTTFTQEFLKLLGVKNRVLSPTFILMRPYPLTHKPFHIAYHIDAYRIDDAKELVALGIKKLFNERGALVIIEWADLVKKIMPKQTLWIEMRHGKGTSERVIVH